MFRYLRVNVLVVDGGIYRHEFVAQSDIDVIVTENGAADIRATTLKERRMLIAQLADPRFRGALMKGDTHEAA